MKWWKNLDVWVKIAAVLAPPTAILVAVFTTIVPLMSSGRSQRPSVTSTPPTIPGRSQEPTLPTVGTPLAGASLRFLPDHAHPAIEADLHGNFSWWPPPDSGESGRLAPDVWDGRWHHVVGTYDKNLVRLFVDGAEIGSGVPVNVDVVYGLPATDDFYIGRFGEEYCPSYFIGDLDEVTVWNRALNADEIARRAALGDVDGSSLAAKWHFDEGTGQTVADASRNRNNGSGEGEQLPWVDGIRGRAIHFTGANWIAVKDSPTLFSQHMSVEAWVRAGQPPANHRYILGKGANKGVDGCDAASYALYTGDRGGVNFYVSNATIAQSKGVTPVTFDHRDCGSWRKASNRYFNVRSCVRHDGKGFTAAIIVQNLTAVTRMASPTAAVYLANRSGTGLVTHWEGKVQAVVSLRPGEAATWTAEAAPTTRCAGVRARPDTSSLWVSSPFKDEDDKTCSNPKNW